MKITRRRPAGRVAVFVDGFNVFHSMKRDDKPDLRRYWWLDYWALFDRLLPGYAELHNVFWCTAFNRSWKQTASKHVSYAKALEARGVTVVRGEFRLRPRKCPKCQH